MATLNAYPLICYQNLAAGQPITTSSEQVGYEGSHLADPFVNSSVWRSALAALTSQNLDVDLGSSQNIDVIALLGTDLTNSATRTPKTAENSAFTSPEYDPGSANCFDVSWTTLLDNTKIYGRPVIVLPGTTLNSRYVRLTLSDATNPNNYLKGAVLWVGPAYQPPYGMQTIEPIYTPVGTPGIERSVTGWKFDMRMLSDAEAVKVESFIQNKLRSGRYLFIPHPLDSKSFISEALYCTCASMKRSEMPSFPRTWQIEIEFTEVED